MKALRFILFWFTLLVLGALFRFPPTPQARAQQKTYARANYADSMRRLRQEFRRLSDSLASLEAMSHILVYPPGHRTAKGRTSKQFNPLVYYYNTREQPRTVYVYKDGALYWVAEKKR